MDVEGLFVRTMGESLGRVMELQGRVDGVTVVGGIRIGGVNAG